MTALRALFLACGAASAAAAAPDGESDPRDASGRVAPIAALAVAPDAPLVLTGASDGTLRFWALAEDGLPVAPASGGRMRGAVTGVALEAQGLACAVDDEGTLAFVASGAAPRHIARHAGGALAIAIAPDGSRVATAGADGSVRLWSLPDGEARGALEGHEGPVASLAFAGDRLLSAGHDGTLRVWELRRGDGGRERERIDLGNRELTAVAASPDGRLALVAGFDGALRLLAGRRLVAADIAQRPHAEWVRSISFSRDGARAVAAAPAESALIVLDLARPEGHVATLVADPRAPSVAAFAPGDRAIVVGRFDGSVGVVALPAGAAADGPGRRQP